VRWSTNLIAYVTLIKVYRAVADGERKYSPAEVQSAEVVSACGDRDPDRLCTSTIERSNPSLRMGQRHFTRLINAFGRKGGRIRGPL
jgi:hypothetical protein